MITEADDKTTPLLGSPYDLRIGMSEKVSEVDVKSALESGEWGFVHSFQTGSAVDGPGVRLVALAFTFVSTLPLMPIKAQARA